MQEIAALLLCKLGGKGGSAAEIKAVLEAAGSEVNEDALAKLVGDAEGKDINELLAAGMELMKNVTMGGGGYVLFCWNGKRVEFWVTKYIIS
jgi:large subunit ribosomal protein LP2